MREITPNKATADELYDRYMVKYTSKNPIARMMLDNYFAKLKLIVDKLDKGDRLLEVGCGPGESSRRILDMLRGQEFEVSDVDERFVAKMKAINLPVPVRQESVLDLQRRDKEYDCVFLLEVLEHIPEYEKALSEVFRVSRKYVVISVPNEPLWRILNMARGHYLAQWGNTPTHVNHWSPKRIRRLISQYGAVLEIYRPIPWTIILARIKSFSKDNM